MKKIQKKPQISLRRRMEAYEKMIHRVNCRIIAFYFFSEYELAEQIIRGYKSLLELAPQLSQYSLRYIHYLCPIGKAATLARKYIEAYDLSVEILNEAAGVYCESGSSVYDLYEQFLLIRNNPFPIELLPLVKETLIALKQEVSGRREHSKRKQRKLLRELESAFEALIASSNPQPKTMVIMFRKE